MKSKTGNKRITQRKKEMKKILSPEQYDKWQKQRLENMQKQRDAWKNKAMRKLHFSGFSKIQ